MRKWSKLYQNVPQEAWGEHMRDQDGTEREGIVHTAARLLDHAPFDHGNVDIDVSNEQVIVTITKTERPKEA